MALFETIRPIERATTIEMLDGGLLTRHALEANADFEPPTTIRTGFELASETELHVLGNLPLVCHAVV